jgi:Lrp/AsnC family transcriptional regulator
MQAELDETDLRILALLQEDASLTAAQVAERVELSQSPCWRRIHRLEEIGVIEKRVAVLSRKQLGFNVTVYVEVKCSRGVRRSLDKFEAAIRSFDEVQEAHMLMGDKDFLLKVVTCDVEAFEMFVRDKLSVLSGVHEVRSFMVLSTVKATTKVPLSRCRPIAR